MVNQWFNEIYIFLAYLLWILIKVDKFLNFFVNFYWRLSSLSSFQAFKSFKLLSCLFFQWMMSHICHITLTLTVEATMRRCSTKWVSYEISQNSQENSCTGVSFLIKQQTTAWNFIKKETLALLFSCEICEIFQNTCTSVDCFSDCCTFAFYF